ncbi:MAG TPA: hypothetical protein VM537_20225, partial [Anaerolineae bacterium]|nr:hypothetical protein [Anaerolineae bacterium]
MSTSWRVKNRVLAEPSVAKSTRGSTWPRLGTKANERLAGAVPTGPETPEGSVVPGMDAPGQQPVSSVTTRAILSETSGKER